MASNQQPTLLDIWAGPQVKKQRSNDESPVQPQYDSLSETLVQSDAYTQSPPDSEIPNQSQVSELSATTASLCTSECCVNATSTLQPPYQTTSQSVFIQTRRLQGTKVRQFSPEWFKTYSWLVLCVTSLKAYCHYCKYCNTRNLISDKQYDSAFVKSGFDNWKKAHERFKQHAQSTCHREAMMKIEQIKQPGVNAQLSSELKRSQQLHRKMLKIQLSSLKYLLRQGLAVRGHEELEGNLIQLLLLRQEECPELKQWIEAGKYLSSDIINEMITSMAYSVLRQILSEIRESCRYALIADEATDVSNKEQLCLTIRWVDKDFNISEDPLELIDVPKTDAQTLSTVIKDSLVRFALPITQCRGQAYDGAANMSGLVSGIAARIQEVEPLAIFVHCLAHCTNLCLKSVGKKIGAVREALDLVMELSQFIRFSPKRSSLFQTLQTQLTPGAPSLKPLCPTRWTVRTKAIQAVVSNYAVLKTALTEIHNTGRDEYALKAAGYLSAMDKFSTFFGLKLSYLIFSATEQLSVSLQGRDTTLQEGVETARLAVRFLESQRNEDKFDRFYSRMVEDAKELTEEPELLRYRRAPTRYDGHSSNTYRYPDAKSYFKQQYYEALETAFGELKSRFEQTRGMPIAAAVEKTLLDSANSGDSNIPEELEQYSKDLDLERLRIQLQMLPELVRTYNQNNPASRIKKVTTLRSLCEVMSGVGSSKTLLCEVFNLLHIALTIPVTSATAERTFSALRRLKTFLRSSMTQPRLNHVVLLHIHKERTDNIDLDIIARDFVCINDRRRNYFGSFD